MFAYLPISNSKETREISKQTILGDFSPSLLGQKGIVDFKTRDFIPHFL